jgi:hypothetical protein
MPPVHQTHLDLKKYSYQKGKRPKYRNLQPKQCCFEYWEHRTNSHLFSAFRGRNDVCMDVHSDTPANCANRNSKTERVRVFETRVLKRVFGPKRDEVTGEWRKLHKEELSDLYSLPNIVRVVKSSRMR